MPCAASLTDRRRPARTSLPIVTLGRQDSVSWLSKVAGIAILAADETGYRMVANILGRGIDVMWLCLDEADRGGWNERIARIADGRVAVVTVASREVSPPPGRDRPAAGVLAWWPRIVKEPLLSWPTRGWLNAHPSYLPFNRGKNPNFWCLAEGTPCGVTLHIAKADVDGGPVLRRQVLETTWEDTGGSVHKRLGDLAVRMVEEDLQAFIDGQLDARAQDRTVGQYHLASEMDEASGIDLDRRYSARELLNLIRARMFPPHPTTWFSEGGESFSVEVTIKRIELRPDDADIPPGRQ